MYLVYRLYKLDYSPKCVMINLSYQIGVCFVSFNPKFLYAVFKTGLVQNNLKILLWLYWNLQRFFFLVYQDISNLIYKIMLMSNPSFSSAPLVYMRKHIPPVMSLWVIPAVKSPPSVDLPIPPTENRPNPNIRAFGNNH